MPRNNTEDLIQKASDAQSFATVCFTITPHNTEPLSEFPRGVYIGTGGNLTVVDKNNNEVTFIDVPSGTILPVRPVFIKQTGTTASNIIGLR